MMLQKLWQGFQLVVVLAFFGLFALWKFAPQSPPAEWLRQLKLHDQRTEEQKKRTRRARNIMDGFEMIVFGLALPPLYLFSTVLFFFSGINPFVLAGTIALSLVLIFVGIRQIVTARR